MMLLGQWADHIDELTAAYEAEHPNVTLEWELTSSSTGSDLLKSKLAADELPDVFDVNYEESTVQWAPHLLNVDDLVEPSDGVAASLTPPLMLATMKVNSTMCR